MNKTERVTPAVRAVIPDSGTDGLQGLADTMTIDAAADHAHVFDYELPS